jgi:hypothetical protein
MAMAAPASVCLIGKRPFTEGAAGASSYLRLLARGIRRTGFTPQVFCTGQRSETTDSAIGAVHRVGVPWPRRRLPWDVEVPLLAPWLVPALVRFGMRSDRPVIFHGVSLRGWAGLLADPPLRHRLAAAARSTFQRRFSSPGMVRALADAYTEVLTGEGAATPALVGTS